MRDTLISVMSFFSTHASSREAALHRKLHVLPSAGISEVNRHRRSASRLPTTCWTAPQAARKSGQSLNHFCRAVLLMAVEEGERTVSAYQAACTFPSGLFP